jgi:non-ribosomal peptide synthetase component F
MAFPGPRLGLRAAYDTRRLAAAAVDRLLAHLTRILEGFAAAPAATLDDLPILSDDEALRAVDEWNAGPDGTDLDGLSDEEVDARIGRLLTCDETPDE